MICPEFQSAICHISLLLFPLGFVRLAVLFFRRSIFLFRIIFFLFQDLFPGSLLCEVPFLLLMDIRYILKSTATVIVFGAEFPAVDQTQERIDDIILQLVGDTTRVDSFIDLMRDYEILEICRTGVISLTRGLTTMRDAINDDCDAEG